MAIGTTRFFQNNTELFSRLNEDLKTLQSQAGSGQADLKLSQNYRDVANLSAAEEAKSETSQFILNSQRVQTDLESLDLAMERFQDLLIRLQEVSVESSNDIFSSEERQGFIQEAKMLKSEILDLANTTDSFGNSLFGGVSGLERPFELSGDGEVNYLGSVIPKEVQVSSGLNVKQNFSGSQVFQNMTGQSGRFSVFELVDDLINSLETDLNSGISSNLFLTQNTTTVKFPDTGAQADIAFSLVTETGETNFAAKIYGNDYSLLVDKINAESATTGISATLNDENKITLQGNSEKLVIKKFIQSGVTSEDATLNIVDSTSSVVLERVDQDRLNNQDISLRITDAFTHVSTMRAEVSTASRRAQDAEATNQDLLIQLEEDISEIKDADLASLLTRIEMLMLQKDAAQATFTRITSKSLFDFLG